MLLGGEIGLDWPQVAEHLRVLSDIFLRLIKVIVAPLIFGTLVTGIAGHGNLRSVGRIGLKSLMYFEVVTTLALLIGVGAIDISRAGEGLTMSGDAGSCAGTAVRSRCTGMIFCCMFFRRILRSPSLKTKFCRLRCLRCFSESRWRLLPEAKREPMLKFCESLSATMFSFTNLVMYFAPIGVGAAVAYTVGHMGIGVLLPLGKLLLTGYAALIAISSAGAAADRYCCAVATCAISSRGGRAGHDCVCDEHF